ncbi:sugar transferase [Polaribacter pectinis]|uniref:Sugar transferase n=1 Tax=Polaribacter pectinis TaxID=2738844 RepID=A0A7G9LAY2_9FLAO|nr:sugar transferase [Polaribacter pectinis]QNM85781.1 sugar transferase [Polaribacter pectinis]
MYKYFFKRFFDILVGLIAFVVLLPIFIVVFFLLIYNNKGTPFFFQQRPGKDGKIFKVIKFKTMNDGKDKNGDLLPDSIRLTKIGKSIRSASLDEIPQLINVIKGDMALIGPRPLLPEYLLLYNDRQHKRHLVKPGITGWAQVNGRNAISWDQKFEFDVWYVENLSIQLDTKIFFMTFAKVFKSEGINTENQATTVRFKGNE